MSAGADVRVAGDESDPMVTPEQFERARRLALQLAGIELFERHRELLARRSARFGLRGPAGWDALLTAAERGDDHARRRIVDLVTTGHTGFFRHPQHFDLAVEHLKHVGSPGRRARAWSVATATGEEAWSLAMAVADGCDVMTPNQGVALTAAEFRKGDIPVAPMEKSDGKLGDRNVALPIQEVTESPVSILATDLNATALETAVRGEYGEATMSALTPAQRARHFESASEGRWRVADSLRGRVQFQWLNLVELPWPVAGRFDVIFCRNVVMYLEGEHRLEVLTHLAERLAPDGLLLLDPTEHPGRAEHLFQRGEPGVYRRRPAVGGQRNARQAGPAGARS